MLLGRERERQDLDRLLASARSGASAVLVLVGEPGIGKTALLGYAADNAGGLRLLRAAGVESETNVPFSALFELLRPTLHMLERIPRPQASALEGALALRPSAGGDRFAVGAATLSLLAAYADEAPALLLIDDAHLLDASSAEALLFALRRLLAEPLGVVIATRDEPSTLRDADLPTRPVGGLDLRSSTELLGTVSEDVAERLHEATAGNPLALLELGDEAVALGATAIDAPVPIPTRVSRAFSRRVETLPDPVRRLLVLVAASDSVEVAPLQRAADSLELDLAGLGAAQSAGLLSLQGGRVEFRHPLVRAAVYGESTSDWRREVHRALAAALPDRDVDRRAWHLALAAVGTDAAASSALEQAGTRASARRAYAVATSAFRRAGALADDDLRRARLLYAAANAAWLAGLADASIDLLAQAQELGPDSDLLVGIEHLRGRIVTRRGPVMEGHALLVNAAERVADTEPEDAVAMLAEAVDACFFAGDAHEMSRVAQRVQELLPERASERTQFLAAMTRGMALVFAGSEQAGIASIRNGVALAERSEELRHDTHLLAWVIAGPMWLRDVDTGRALVEAAIDTARAQAAVGLLPWLLDRIAHSHAGTESWGRARLEYHEALQLARETGQRVELAAVLAGLAWLEAREGRQDECRAHAAEASELCERLGVGLYATWAMRALGDLELGLGNADAAIEHFEAVEHCLAGLGVADVDLSPAAELVDAYLRTGQTEAAAAAGARLQERAGAKGQPWSLARAARCRGMLAADDGFDAHFEDALALHEQTPDAFETARTHLAFGARLRRARKRVRAREQLRAALEISEALGAAPLSALIRGELAATGETARRRDVSTLDQLTPQELHIAQLLADGRTTREAAAALFLSPKTIEYHLRSVYRKLGIKSRVELTKALGSR